MSILKDRYAVGPRPFSLLNGSHEVTALVAAFFDPDVYAVRRFSTGGDVELFGDDSFLRADERLVPHGSVWERGVSNAYQDRLECCAWASVSVQPVTVGAGPPAVYKCPEYIAEHEWIEYLTGYLDAVRDLRKNGGF